MDRQEQLNAVLNDAFEASNNLQDATERYRKVQQQLHQSQTILRDAKDVILREHAADPKPLGSNEAAREATLRGRLTVLQSAVDVAEYEILEARSRAEVARMVWDFGRFSLSLMQLTVEMEKLDAKEHLDFNH